MEIEIREEPENVLTDIPDIAIARMSDITSQVINDITTSQFQRRWRELNITNGMEPLDFHLQEPFQNSKINISVIHHIKLLEQPAQCREQSPCTIQPKLSVYDIQGNVIHQLGYRDRPWQVKATIINGSDSISQGDIADYINGTTQYMFFSLSNIGSYEVQFTLIQPDDVNRFVNSFISLQLINLYLVK